MRIDDFPADAWVCEQHPDQPWPHPSPEELDGQCAGPGMLREDFDKSKAGSPVLGGADISDDVQLETD